MKLALPHLRSPKVIVSALTIVILSGALAYGVRSNLNGSDSVSVESGSEQADGQGLESKKSDTKPKTASDGETAKTTAPKPGGSTAKKQTTSSSGQTTPSQSTPPPATTPPSGGGTCTNKPVASNTGSSGTLTPDGRSVLSTDGEVVRDATFAGDLEIRGDGVQLINVHVEGDILINEADGVTIDRISTRSIAVSSALNTTVQYAHITAYEGDSFHITSDGSKYINGFTLRYSFIDRPYFNPGSLAHWDGVQIRGANNVTIFCNNFDVGAWQDPYNALIYPEQANGGNDNITVDNNWLSGSNFAIMASLADVPLNFRITNNKLSSADFYYGYCALGGGYTPTYVSQIVQTGNTLDGAPMAQVCTNDDI